MSKSSSGALPIAQVGLHIAIVSNWIIGAAVLALLVATVVAQDATLTALGIPPGSKIHTLIGGLRVVAVLGLIGVPLNDVVLRGLRSIVDTVRSGDPFVATNADRLQTIAWALLALQVLSLIVGLLGKGLSTPAQPIDFDAGFSAAGWLAVLMTFVLARVFAEGARMREDLEGTV